MQVVTNPGIVYVDNILLTTDPLSIDEFNASSVKVYPNPSSNDWNISSDSIITKITLFDILGKNVMNYNSNSDEVVISTTNIKSGVYFAKIEGLKGSKTIKLIKE